MARSWKRTLLGASTALLVLVGTSACGSNSAMQAVSTDRYIRALDDAQVPAQEQNSSLIAQQKKQYELQLGNSLYPAPVWQKLELFASNGRFVSQYSPIVSYIKTELGKTNGFTEADLRAVLKQQAASGSLDSSKITTDFIDMYRVIVFINSMQQGQAIEGKDLSKIAQKATELMHAQQTKDAQQNGTLDELIYQLSSGQVSVYRPNVAKGVTLKGLDQVDRQLSQDATTQGQ